MFKIKPRPKMTKIKKELFSEEKDKSIDYLSLDGGGTKRPTKKRNKPKKKVKE